MQRIVLITGGSRGIGRACALAFAENGDRLVILYERNKNTANATLNNLKGDGHCAYQCDLQNLNQIREVFTEIIREFERIDVLINSAGVAIEHDINLQFEEWMQIWNKTIGVNLTGMAACCHLAAQSMIRQGKGSIINISSRGAFRGEPNMPAYGASKAGVNGLSQSLAKSLGSHGISVSAIAPGFVKTDMAKPFLESTQGEELKNESPFGRIANPEEVAHVAVFLANKKSEFLSGGIVDLNGASFLRM